MILLVLRFFVLELKLLLEVAELLRRLCCTGSLLFEGPVFGVLLVDLVLVALQAVHFADLFEHLVALVELLSEKHVFAQGFSLEHSVDHL